MLPNALVLHKIFTPTPKLIVAKILNIHLDTLGTSHFILCREVVLLQRLFCTECVAIQFLDCPLLLGALSECPLSEQYTFV